MNIKGWYSTQLDGMSYKEEKLLRRYNKLRNIQSIHTLQLADNRTVKDRGQTNPDRGFPESLLPVKGLQRSFCAVNDNLRRCCVLLTTWPMCNTPGYVSSYKCGTKCINFDVAFRLVESYCFQWVILLVRKPKMGLNSTFFKIVETGSIGDV